MARCRRLQHGNDENDIDKAGERQPCTPDRHPVVFAAQTGEDKTGADEQAECGNCQEGTLVKGYGFCNRLLADSVTHFSIMSLPQVMQKYTAAV